MTATLIDGKRVAAGLRTAVAARVAALPFRPGLAVVLVGDHPASVVYVRNKDRAAQEAGIAVQTIRVPVTEDETALLKIIARLNADEAVDGILVQLPLPDHIAPRRVIEAIDPAKDVDGLHPLNVGLLTDGLPCLAPCTPRGVMVLLADLAVVLRGARAVVIGRSALVGRPMATMLIAADATVTIVHSRSADPAAECRRADVLVTAVGRPGLVEADWIAPGATVIDVGTNRTADGRLVGDVNFAACAEVAGALTPVPGGVGPMTIACLLENTLSAALRRRSLAV